MCNNTLHTITGEVYPDTTFNKKNNKTFVFCSFRPTCSFIRVIPYISKWGGRGDPPWRPKNVPPPLARSFFTSCPPPNFGYFFNKNVKKSNFGPFFLEIDNFSLENLPNLPERFDNHPPHPPHWPKFDFLAYLLINLAEI